MTVFSDLHLCLRSSLCQYLDLGQYFLVQTEKRGIFVCHVPLPECSSAKVSELTLNYSRAKMRYKIKLIQTSARL